ncbi:hypothetical protein M979_1978 [Buttiauxella noackiae ATCC 51607]|uniref:Phosphoserine phosphatase n=2 Tax=Buttiauxella TaxID=82976 RepID=A0A1B7HQK5_9ENTR|nr:hypothetical protein M979_1978 [Buttiauxella noackiae ATCC 51607]
MVSIKYDLTKIFCLYMMKGYSISELKDLSENYVKTLNWRHDVLKKVNLLVESGYTPVIVSASLSFIVESVSQHLGIAKFQCSTPELYDGMFTGHLLTDLQGRKVDIIRAENASKSLFFTDNLDDINCKPNIHYFIAISRIKNVSYWRRHKVITYVV